LIGFFGGILVQEMAKYIDAENYTSSVKVTWNLEG
jgi:hypothetical protein